MRSLLQLAIWAGVLATTSGCSPLCENEIVHLAQSPSGARTAVVFNRNCGATTGFNTQVSILPSADAASENSGNVLALDDQVPLQIHWTSESQLSIAGVASARVFKQESQVAGVTVTYAK
jgi:hypothetical protein